ncbi:MAG: Peptide chain release factor 2 [candidate division CPR2 bacterium GW2011_GWC1_39_9]|uniref:Peptide chain release factor 2 n=1 Tax=candidate division CPR2 bacterium GW2011_GWC2_39_10 TaxID=1618345 RepID=A0A0G0LTH8_UNCC2|nr:MAG: Peptide chain release factor 2 [candidate division CPR2 bacterium GW2011_GWC2_39_10]KKR34947.1 MAG: Peptide chain release factor 2 [candidate division CPR2 bacterium GW2011_GWC1_39_9]
MEETKEILYNLKTRVDQGYSILKIDSKKEDIERLENETLNPHFWDLEGAAIKMKKLGDLKNFVADWLSIKNDITDLIELLSMVKPSDVNLSKEIQDKTIEIQNKFEKMEFQMLLSGEYDDNSAILSIYAGAGGTEAQDWSEMLLRMYKRFADSHEFETKITSISPGEEAGIKSTTLEIKGSFAYGYLKSEAGVHRLVRISPFDADKARHTSFALVDVLPEIEDIDTKINEDDLRIDTFRSGGHGGQGVNTTDSAVRITHMPTGIAASVQNERSQLQNKQTALKILHSRLVAFEDKRQKEKISEIRGEAISAEWGNQIRSYVMQPYTKVKDHRTNFETSNVQLVLDGGIDGFIEAYLKNEASKNNK